jgi:hypothetical protein
MVKRNRRSGVEDRWTKTVRDEHGNMQNVPSARHGKGLRWLARYVDDRGREHTKAVGRKADATRWLDKGDLRPRNRHVDGSETLGTDLRLPRRAVDSDQGDAGTQDCRRLPLGAGHADPAALG